MVAASGGGVGPPAGGRRPPAEGEGRLTTRADEGEGGARSPTAPAGDQPAAAAAGLRIPPDELAAAIAQAMRAIQAPAERHRLRRGVDATGLGAGGWALLVAGTLAGGVAALIAGAVLGIALAGYLAAPNRLVEVGAAALAAVGGLRGGLRVRRALRAGSWRMLGGASLDLALALCAAALAAGMRA